MDNTAPKHSFWTYSGVTLLAVIAAVAAWVGVDRPVAVASGLVDWVTGAALLWAVLYFLSR